MSALKGVFAGSDGKLFFPHFAVNKGFTTLIGMVNAASSAANLILTAYLGDGTQIGPPVNRSLPPGAQLLESVGDLFGIAPGNLATGYIVARSSTGGLVGFTSFRYDDGLTRSAAAVPAMAVPRQRLLFSHIAHQVLAGSGGTYQTGIALLNPFGVTIGYTMKVFDGSGALLAQKTDALGPGQRISRILSHPVEGVGFFTQTLSLGSGHVEVSTDYGLLGFELFFTETYSQLASVPAQVP